MGNVSGEFYNSWKKLLDLNRGIGMYGIISGWFDNAYRTDMGLCFGSLEPNRGLLVNRSEVDDSIDPNLSKQK
jgi:hypothetical protein